MINPVLWQPKPQAILEFNAIFSIVMESLYKMMNELEAEWQRMEKQRDDHIDRHPDLKNDLR